MALKKLSTEQVESMTLEEKDQWWLDNIYKGKVPQLTFRSITLGIIIGAIQSFMAIYIGLKAPIGGGSGVLAVVLAFSIFSLSKKMVNNNRDTLIECNAVQSISISAANAVFSLSCSLPAYMLVTNAIIPQYQAILWMISTSILGVVYAMLFKKQLINDKQLPCQEGAACAIVLDTFNQHANVAKTQFKLLTMPLFVASLVEFCSSDLWHNLAHKMKASFLIVPHSLGAVLSKLPKWLGKYSLTNDLCLNLETSLLTYGLGGMMSFRSACSMLLGGAISYLVLAPLLISYQIITSGGYRAISGWSIWPGVIIMMAELAFDIMSNVSVGLKKMIQSKNLCKTPSKKDILSGIEVPKKPLFVVWCIVSVMTLIAGNIFFDIPYYIGCICIVLSYFLAYIASYAGALCSIVPVGGISKISQIVTTMLSSGKVGLAAAGLTGEVACNAGALMLDLKPGYMLGAGPRQQVMGHIIGTFVGTVSGCWFFYKRVIPKIELWGSESLPCPGTMMWKAITDMLSQNWGKLHPSIMWACWISFAIGLCIAFLNRKKILRISASMLGFGMFLPFNISIQIFVGSLVFQVLLPALSGNNKVFTQINENKDVVCAGLLAGGAIAGVLTMLIESLL